jgi:peptide/nickel transport system permease protein
VRGGASAAWPGVAVPQQGVAEMWAWLLKRLGQILPTLVILSFIIFGLQQLMPGDPAVILAGEERGDPQVLAQIRAELRLDQPLWAQYLYWVGNVLQGDFGFSWRIRMPVSSLILEKLPVTAQLASMAFLIAIVIGVPLGILSAVKKDTAWDWAANGIALFGISTPNFWLGIMMILFFSVQLGWLPPSGYVPLWEDPVQSLATTIMPAFVLGTGVASVLMRHTRAAMLTALSQDYVRTARAKGLSERVVVWKHALRNALIPVVTLGTIEFGRLLAGAVLTEQIFTIPGFGKLVVDAVFNRDYPVVQGVVLATALIFVALSLVADILYMLINPRLRQA